MADRSKVVTVVASVATHTYTVRDAAKNSITIAASENRTTGNTFTFSGGPINRDGLPLLEDLLRQLYTGNLPAN